MYRVTPPLRVLAERIIAHDAKGLSRKKQVTVFLAVNKLRPHLVALMGNGGYRALVMRALVLVSVEVAWLRTVRVADDGTLDRIDEAATKPGEIMQGRVVLMAQVLGLLIAFIGESLMLRLVREIWPRLPRAYLHVSETSPQPPETRLKT